MTPSELKYAGWDGVQVVGKASKPVYIAIMDDKVEIRDASHVWGKGAEEAEDILRMASTDAEEYENPSFLRSIRLRCPWLTVNLGTAMLSSFVVSLFQDTISQYVLLAALMPVIAGLGGLFLWLGRR